MTVHFIGHSRRSRSDHSCGHAISLPPALSVYMQACLSPKRYYRIAPDDAELINSAPLDLNEIQQVFRTAHEKG